MKFPQILILLALSLAMLSCRETLGEQNQNTHKVKDLPSSERDTVEKPSRKQEDTKPQEPSTSQPLQKKKSKELDTLKPRVVAL